MGRYGPAAHPVLVRLSILRKDIPVCFAGSFLRFRQLDADVCIE